MKGSRVLFVASWVILLLLCASVAIFSFGSVVTAYRGTQDNITPAYTLDQLGAATAPEVAVAIRGRRATAATWALGCALLSALVILVPYRRGEAWAWWALLIAWGVPQFLSLARIAALGTTFGSGASGTVLALLLLGLMAGVPRFFMQRDAMAEL